MEKYQAEDGEDEARFVAMEIQRQCGYGDYHRAAVLVRASRQTMALPSRFLQELPGEVINERHAKLTSARGVAGMGRREPWNNKRW